MNEKFTKKEISTKVKEIFGVEFTNYKGKISLNTTFDEINAQKLDKKEFLMQVEEFFEIRIAQRNLIKINTVNDLVEHINNLI